MKHKYQGSYTSYLLMYFFFYFCIALFSCFISVYLLDLGYQATQVSFVVASSYLLSALTQPFIGRMNDKVDQKKWNTLMMSIAMIASLIFTHLHNILLIALVYSIVLSLLNSTKVIVENKALYSKYQYSSIRIWATIGYAVGSKLGGVLYDVISPQSLYYLFFIGMLLCVIGFIGTQDVKKESVTEQEEKTSHNSKNIIIYLIIVFLFYGITNTHTLYLPAYLKTQGMSMNLISTVIFISTLIELPVIMLSKYYMNKLSNKQLLTLCFSLLIVELASYLFIHSLTLIIIITLLTKTVVTMSFIMINLKVVRSITSISYQNTLLSIVSSCNSLSSIVFQMLSGYLIEYISYQSFYFILFIFALSGLGIILITHIPTKQEKPLFT